VLTPGEKRGEVYAELRGELMGILEFVNVEKNQQLSHSMPAVVACPRNQELTRYLNKIAGFLIPGATLAESSPESNRNHSGANSRGFRCSAGA
jgi:hypothetical protein